MNKHLLKATTLFFTLAIGISNSWAGSVWHINGTDVYVRNKAKKAMSRAISSASSAGSGSIGGVGSGNIACETILCLGPYVGLGTDGGPACAVSKQAYFGIRVFIPFEGYDPNLTQVARGVFLSMCPSGVNKGIAKGENQVVGKAFEAP